MKKNITLSESATYAARKRKPLLHHFVTNLIASFGDVTCLKRYAMFMFSFLLLLLMSGSYSLFAKENSNNSINQEIVVIDSIDELSTHQKEAVLKQSTQTPFPSAEERVYLMNHPSQAFPYTIYLGGQSSYNIEDIALLHYGNAKAAKHVVAANPELDFNSLKTGDRIYLPLINPDILSGVALLNETSATTLTDEAVSTETNAVTETQAVSEEATEAVTEAATEAPEIIKTEATTTTNPTSETTVDTAPANTVSETMPAAASNASYVVPASAEVVDMYVRFVAAESSPSWGYEGHLMIAQTIINRAINGHWGDLEGVMTSPGQYDVYSNGRYQTIDVTDSQRQAAMDALHGATAFSRDVLYFCTDYAYNSSSWWSSLDHQATYGNTMFFAP